MSPTSSGRSRSRGKAEKEASKELFKFERNTRAFIVSKKKSMAAAKFDLKNTKMIIVETMNDLEKHQKMIDDAVNVLEDPKPARVDTVMSNADRARDRVRQRWPSFLIKMAELSHQDLSPVSNGLRPA